MVDIERWRALGCLAFVWGYPFVRAAQLRHNLTRPRDPDDPGSSAVAAAPVNVFGHARTLATPATRVGVAPNNDTLYSLAWLDLTNGPFVVETPDFKDRYYVFQMGQADSSSARCWGQRSHGGQLPSLFISRPGDEDVGPEDMLHVRSNYRFLMVAARVLVDGPADLPTVHRLQDQISVRSWRGPAARASGAGVWAAATGQVVASGQEDPRLEFLYRLGDALMDAGVAPSDAGVLESLASIGVSVDAGFRVHALGSAQRVAVADGLLDGEAQVRAKTLDLGHKVNGWSINYRGASFGDDYLLRAAVAMDQIFIVEAAEALYPSARVDSLGEPLDGAHCYRMRFAAGDLPPVSAFWSITLYFAKGFLVPNAIDRWSIGDRTPGIVFEEDGSLEIRIQQAAPESQVGNWLPAPAEPFMLLLRLYHPLPRASSGAWVPPPITRVGG
jgi:hypothetical protein